MAYFINTEKTNFIFYVKERKQNYLCYSLYGVTRLFELDSSLNWSFVRTISKEDILHYSNLPAPHPDSDCYFTKLPYINKKLEGVLDSKGKSLFEFIYRWFEERNTEYIYEIVSWEWFPDKKLWSVKLGLDCILLPVDNHSMCYMEIKWDGITNSFSSDLVL